MAFTTVSSSASSGTLLEADTSRKSLIIANSDANTLYVLLATGTASATNYSYLLAQNAQIELPFYTGKVVGVWSSAGSGKAMITSW
jgi:hypothetical protein